MATDRTIILDLTKIYEVEALDIKNLIHRDAYKRVVDLVIEDLRRIDNYNPENKFRRLHNSILINGQRGSGKTSFLLTLIKNLPSELEKEKLDIYIFDIIDPTLISKRQNILLLVISLIHKAVNKAINEQDIYSSKFDIWMESLRKLVSGLTLIDTIGKPPLDSEIWDDELLVVERGLYLSRAGFEFERTFHIFIKKSLDILKKQAFLLVFDDIDIDFSKGLELLETLRKFISSPNILAILAGDFSLFADIVRKDKWNQFGELLIHEEDKKNLIFKKQVEEMTQQYLQKLFHAHRRVNLFTLYHYLYFETTKEIEVKYKLGEQSNKNHIPLKNYLSNIIDKFYYSNQEFKEGYLELITKFPLRTLLQFLIIHTDHSDNDKDTSNYLERARKVLSKVAILFLEDLSSIGLNAEDLDHLRVESGLYILFRSLLNNTKETELVNFKVPTGDRIKDYLYFIIPNLINAYSDFSLIIEFLTKVTLPLFIRNKNKEVGSLLHSPMFNSPIQFIDVIDDLMSELYKTKSSFLLLRLIRDPNEVDNTSKKTLNDTIDKVLKDQNKKNTDQDKRRNNILLYLILPSIRIYFPGKGESYSFYCPLINLYLVFKSIDDKKLYSEKDKTYNSNTLNVDNYLYNRIKKIMTEIESLKDMDSKEEEKINSSYEMINEYLNDWNHIFRGLIKKVYENEGFYEIYRKYFNIISLHNTFIEYLHYVEQYNLFIKDKDKKEEAKPDEDKTGEDKTEEKNDEDKYIISQFFQRAFLNFFLFTLNKPILFDEKRKLIKGIIQQYTRYLNIITNIISSNDIKDENDVNSNALRLIGQIIFILTIHPLLFPYYQKEFAKKCCEKFKDIFEEEEIRNKVDGYLNKVFPVNKDVQDYINNIAVSKFESKDTKTTQKGKGKSKKGGQPENKEIVQ